jgi:uncharacterized protein involved in copper resistance
MASNMLKWLAGILLVVTVSACGQNAGGTGAKSPAAQQTTSGSSPQSTRASAGADHAAIDNSDTHHPGQNATPADKAEAEHNVNELANALNQLN